MTEQFKCHACGAKYRWKPQLAGKRVKCRCGQPIAVPLEDAVRNDADDDNFLLADIERAAAKANIGSTTPENCPECHNPLRPNTVLCTNCGYNLETGQKVQMQAEKPSPRAEAAGRPERKFDKSRSQAHKPSTAENLGCFQWARKAGGGLFLLGCFGFISTILQLPITVKGFNRLTPEEQLIYSGVIVGGGIVLFIVGCTGE